MLKETLVMQCCNWEYVVLFAARQRWSIDERPKKCSKESKTTYPRKTTTLCCNWSLIETSP